MAISFSKSPQGKKTQKSDKKKFNSSEKNTPDKSEIAERKKPNQKSSTEFTKKTKGYLGKEKSTGNFGPKKKIGSKVGEELGKKSQTKTPNDRAVREARGRRSSAELGGKSYGSTGKRNEETAKLDDYITKMARDTGDKYVKGAGGSGSDTGKKKPGREYTRQAEPGSKFGQKKSSSAKPGGKSSSQNSGTKFGNNSAGKSSSSAGGKSRPPARSNSAPSSGKSANEAAKRPGKGATATPTKPVRADNSGGRPTRPVSSSGTKSPERGGKPVETKPAAKAEKFQGFNERGYAPGSGVAAPRTVSPAVQQRQVPPRQAGQPVRGGYGDGGGGRALTPQQAQQEQLGLRHQQGHNIVPPPRPQPAPMSMQPLYHPVSGFGGIIPRMIQNYQNMPGAGGNTQVNQDKAAQVRADYYRRGGR